MSSCVTCKSVIVSTLFLAHFFAAFTWLKVDAIIPSNKYILHFAESLVCQIKCTEIHEHGVNICKLVINGNCEVRVNSHNSGLEYRLVYQMQNNAWW